MILKVHQHYREGWTWVDNIDKVDHYGRLAPAEPDAPVDGCFTSFEELRAAVAKMWGESPRSFELEIWPSWGGINGSDTPKAGEEVAPMYQVRSVVGRRRDGTTVLCILHTEAYLLGDNGDTIERL